MSLSLNLTINHPISISTYVYHVLRLKLAKFLKSCDTNLPQSIVKCSIKETIRAMSPILEVNDQ